MLCPSTILFDLDGTLVDSVPDLAHSIDLMLAELGLPERGEAQVRHWVGNGAPRLVKRALLGQMEGEPEAELFAKAMPRFLDIYADHSCENSHPYPGVRAGLAVLAAAGIPLGCVTNKPARFTEPLLAHLELNDYFGCVVSGDTLPVQKPNPAPLRHVADFYKVSPRQALMVGDSISDVEAARAAEFRVVCVSYGYNHGRDIREAKPDAVIDSIAELPKLLGLAKQ